MKKKAIAAVACHLALIITLISVVGYFGILSRNGETESADKFTGELERNVTIRVLENDTAKELGYLDALLSAFNEKYKEYGIVAVDANMDQYTDLETGGPYGYGPDVLYQANDAVMKYVDGKHIMPLPIEEFDCYGTVCDNAWRAYEASVSGQTFTFGVPVNVQQPLLYYRKDLLPQNWESEWDDDKNGIPDMVENWSDMYKYSQQVVSQNNGKYGYMKSLNDGYFASGYFLSYGAYVFGGDDRKDTKDVGFSKGEGYKGANIIRTLASVMNMECTEDTITKNSYSRLAQGVYFATMTTPDVYSLFYKELVNQYISQGLSRSDAELKAKENLVVTNVPKLPVSGDLNDTDGEMMDMTVMGGVNGYAISSYTKAPNAALEFVKFATSYEMISLRCEMLGISPARRDIAEELGGLSKMVFDNLENGSIYVMPSVRALGQVWTPLQTFCALIADDILTGKNVYNTDEKIKARLEEVDKQIYDAINTLN